MGPQAVEVFNMFVFANTNDKEKFDKVVEKFDGHCSPKKDETFERCVFSLTHAITKLGHATLESLKTQ